LHKKRTYERRRSAEEVTLFLSTDTRGGIYPPLREPSIFAQKPRMRSHNYCGGPTSSKGAFFNWEVEVPLVRLQISPPVHTNGRPKVFSPQTRGPTLKRGPPLGPFGAFPRYPDYNATIPSRSNPGMFKFRFTQRVNPKFITQQSKVLNKSYLQN